jgi:hypothetical protein
METRGALAKIKLDEIKILLKTGKIDFDEAKEQAKEPLKALNEEMEKIAKAFGRKHYKIVFTSFMR